jgi:acid stress-induced BolA-like protein IbaG/YrbA
MTGTRDHWEAVIISSHFEGARLIARQQAVYRALGELMAGPIHAFTMTTLTPAEAIERGVKINSAATSSHDEGSQGSGGLVTLS